MNKEEAYKIVFDDLTREGGCDLFRGIYDAKNGKDSYMNGISLVMEYIANQVSEQTYDSFVDMFFEEQRKGEKSQED